MATTTGDGTTDRTATAPPRRRRSRRSEPATGGPGRGRGPRLAGEALVANLVEMVDRLVEENRELKRAVAMAQRTQGAVGLGQAARALSGLQRRVSQALSSTTTPRRGRGGAAEAAAAPRPRRKVTDPEVLERRRQALAKARAARAAKREAGGQ